MTAEPQRKYWKQQRQDKAKICKDSKIEIK